jgi:hypothetical protein
MKKILLAIAVLSVTGGCLPFSLTPNPAPTVDVAATSAANMQTAVVQTLTAQPTSTALPVIDTTAPTLTPEATLSPTVTISPTTGFETSAVATGTFDIVTSTGVVMTEVPAGSASETPTLGVRTYGTLPPLVPFAHITLINRAKAEAYISLHVDLDGSNTVIEYPVNGTILIQAPLGFYRYVAWVGGREMVGEFRLKKDQDLTIILYKDRIEIK